MLTKRRISGITFLRVASFDSTRSELYILLASEL